MNNKPIGIFDSGLGGLSVWREVYAMLPGESLIYYGDGKNCPYGSRPEEEVMKFTVEALEFLLGKGVKLVVVACNTATAAAIDLVRKKYDIPIVGMVPAVKPAAMSTRTGTVAILATKRSLEGEKLHQYKNMYAYGLNVIPVVGEGFVELVEDDREDSPEALEIVRSVVEPLIAQGADRIVLGCTHYPFLSHLIREVIGGRDVEIVDPAPAIARRVRQLLSENDMAAGEGHKPEYGFYTLAGDDYVGKMIRKSGIDPGKVIEKK